MEVEAATPREAGVVPMVQETRRPRRRQPSRFPLVHTLAGTADLVWVAVVACTHCWKKRAEVADGVKNRSGEA